jgi:hypothetical protein
MNELFSGTLAPITYTAGFIECDCACAVEAYLRWQIPLQQSRNVKLLRCEFTGSLEEVFCSLLPLTSVERRRFLFLPTTGQWTAFFDNGHQSTDAFPTMSYLARSIGCRSLRATLVPDWASTGAFPARVLEIYGPNETEFLNYIRSVSVVFDGTKCAFDLAGEPQPFEELDRYKARRIQDRFTETMLDSYLNAMGIRAFAEDFYRSDGSILISKDGPIAASAVEFSLQQLRRSP